MRKRSDSLNALNPKSRDDTFGVDDLDWSLEVDRAKFWEPDDLRAMCFAPSFRSMNAQKHRRCNQRSAS